jgi:transcriptional regulator with XRE-family HTH domain
MFTAPVPYLGPETEGLVAILQRFGQELRRCRMQAGMSQTMLADEAGVSQSTISRLERGRAPQAAMVKLVLLGEVLGHRLPLAFCPHDHGCAWERLDAVGRPVRSPALQPDWWLATGLPMPEDDEPSALIAMPDDD